MKYVPPYGITDPDAHYINGNPQTGQMGSIPPAAAFENPMREIAAVIAGSKITPADADLAQMAKGIRSQAMNYADDTGSVNALSVAFDPPLGSYTVGLPIRVKVANNNTGAATINAGAGAVQIIKPNGAQVGGGDLPQNGLIDLVYDGTHFQMINFGGAGGATGPGDVFIVNIPYTVDSSAGANQIIANFSPALTSIVPGSIVMVKMVNTNTGPTSMNVNGIGNKPVFAATGAALIYGDLQAGAVHVMRYDGTQWWIDPSPTITGNVTFNVANNAQIDALFVSLSRKRIASNATVKILLSSGVYSGFVTYHADADRMRIEGTMLAAAPVSNNFSKTGNSASARANDNANNLAMLRTRFGTEIRFNNPATAGGGVVMHAGPGQITFANLLFVGPNVASPQPYIVIGTFGGGSCNCDTVSIWGAGQWGFGALSSYMGCTNCFSCAAQSGGFASMFKGSMTLWDNCGSFGGSVIGIYCAASSQLDIRKNSDVQMNAGDGVTTHQAAQTIIGSAGPCSITGNALDLRAQEMGMCHVYAGAVAYGSALPAANTEGNYNSLMIVV